MTKKKKFGARDFLLYFALCIPMFSAVCFLLMPDYCRVIFTVYRWQAVTATVDSTEIESPWLGFINRHYHYEPLVHYHFDVNGVTYTGSHIMMPGGERWHNDAAYDLRDYKPGQKIQVFYDPSSPGTGAIRKPSYLCLYLALGGVFLIMTLTMVNVYFYQRKQSSTEHAKK